MRRWVSMAAQAPPHAKGLVLLNHFHSINATMTTGATDTSREMNTVIKIGIIWKHVHTNPLDGFIGVGAGPKLLDLFALCFHIGVTVETGGGRRYRRSSTSLNRVVTISAIDTHFASMQLVAERDRLSRLVPNVGVVG